MLKGLGLLSGLLCYGLFSQAALAEMMQVTWYGPNYHGNETASGEIFDRWGYTAAHASWPLGTRVRVTNPDTGASIVVRVNDRMPSSGLDLSEQAALDLGIHAAGVATMDVEVVSWGG